MGKKNKLSRFADMATYPNCLQYTFEQLEASGFPLRGRWHEDYFHNSHPIVVELGCGKGEYTVGLARRYPEKNFIGLDIKGARMWTGATEALEANLSNVAFVRTHIELITRFFAPNEVSEIWITFCDPQMKKVSKRLTGTRFMARYAQILQPNGIVHLKCDSPFLYTYTMAMVEVNALPLLAATTDLYAASDASERGGENAFFAAHSEALRTIQTAYERQWLSRGFAIKYMAFTLGHTAHEWKEPEIEIPLDDYRSYGRQKRSALEVHQ